jgi:hypothetical protein
LRYVEAAKVGKWRDVGAWDIEPGAEVIPKADAELGAGLGEAEEGIAGVATEIAAGAPGDFAPCDNPLSLSMVPISRVAATPISVLAARITSLGSIGASLFSRASRSLPVDPLLRQIPNPVNVAGGPGDPAGRDGPVPSLGW